MKTLLAFFLLLPYLGFSAEVRHLQPPHLDANNFGKRLICYRPFREHSPYFAAVQQDDKVIIHNYGHGGGGWSIGPGSVQYCHALFCNKYPEINKSTPIAIVGGGCIGLFTAYNLLREGFSHITIYASTFDDLASHHAGGLLSLRTLGEDSEMDRLMESLAVTSYQFYLDISKGTHQDFQTGASVMTTYFESLEDSELENLVGKVMEPPKDVIIDFNNGYRYKMIAYDDSLFINTGAMMQQLYYIVEEKTKIKTKKIENFSELKESIIFNCSGLGAKSLNNDSQINPIQGHLILLENQPALDLNYMLIVNWAEGYTLNGQPFSRTLDFFPKSIPGSNQNSIGVLGGTFIPCQDDTIANEHEFTLLIERARQFFYRR